MSNLISEARCFKHVSREAAAKCPSCSKFYCRECVTEHEGRVLCVVCLEAELAIDEKDSEGIGRAILSVVLAISAYFLIVYLFFVLGRFLLSIPSDFHSGILFE